MVIYIPCSLAFLSVYIVGLWCDLFVVALNARADTSTARGGERTHCNLFVAVCVFLVTVHRAYQQNKCKLPE